MSIDRPSIKTQLEHESRRYFVYQYLRLYTILAPIVEKLHEILEDLEVKTTHSITSNTKYNQEWKFEIIEKELLDTINRVDHEGQSHIEQIITYIFVFYFFSFKYRTNFSMQDCISQVNEITTLFSHKPFDEFLSSLSGIAINKSKMSVEYKKTCLKFIAILKKSEFTINLEKVSEKVCIIINKILRNIEATPHEEQSKLLCKRFKSKCNECIRNEYPSEEYIHGVLEGYYELLDEIDLLHCTLINPIYCEMDNSKQNEFKSVHGIRNSSIANLLLYMYECNPFLPTSILIKKTIYEFGKKVLTPQLHQITLPTHLHLHSDTTFVFFPPRDPVPGVTKLLEGDMSSFGEYEGGLFWDISQSEYRFCNVSIIPEDFEINLTGTVDERNQIKISFTLIHNTTEEQKTVIVIVKNQSVLFCDHINSTFKAGDGKINWALDPKLY